jgi:hypothetical protein
MSLRDVAADGSMQLEDLEEEVKRILHVYGVNLTS